MELATFLQYTLIRISSCSQFAWYEIPSYLTIIAVIMSLIYGPEFLLKDYT